MPFSDEQGKIWALKRIEELDPSTVLDIGPGFGYYGQRIRWLEKQPFALNAVEVWGPYVEKFDLERIYDEVYVCDVRHISKDLTSGYDLVIVGDVIEHMTKHEARQLLIRLIESNKNVLIAFPVLHLEQGAWEGNTFEKHIDHWSEEDMDEFLKTRQFYVVDKHVADVLAYYLVTA